MIDYTLSLHGYAHSLSNSLGLVAMVYISLERRILISKDSRGSSEGMRESKASKREKFDRMEGSVDL